MSIDKMDPKRSTHVVVDEDLLQTAHQEAEKREITFSELYRRALRREMKYPSLITEIRDLRRDVDEIADDVDKNLELIGRVFEILDKHVKRGIGEKTSV